jgi:hypothetical protein
MVPTTEWYWYLLLVAMMVAAIGWFLFRANQLIQLTLMGNDSKRLDHWGTRLKLFGVYVLGQLRMYNRKGYTWAGVAHAITFWGFLVIQVTTIILFAEGLFPGFHAPLLHNNPGWLLFVDITQFLVLAAMVTFFYRRLVTRP